MYVIKIVSVFQLKTAPLIKLTAIFVMPKLIAIAALFFLFLTAVRARSTGAPPEACADISPQHGGISQLNGPYSLNVSQLTAAGGYIPGRTYTRMYLRNAVWGRGGGK